jgi:hypothetical protein
MAKYGTPYTSETGRAAISKRWAASAQERTDKRIDELVRMAPPLTPSQKAKLRALLGGA